ncbi:MAG TPA: MOSC domain-containing protein [Anaerolineales bacterium]|nr:MOSC domain-containing protein [Anaerolineales bacterium]
MIDPEGQNQAYIFQINASPGGVPKLAVSAGEITFEGLAGDRQSNRDVHGGPDRALCLYSQERILALQREGHPIYPGAVGENLTIAGLDWEAVAPGIRLVIGERVRIVLTRYTAPCNTIVAAFSDRNSNRISQKLHPGWSRLYARVEQPGFIKVGDRIRVIRD